VFGDPHLHLAHGARADFRGRHGGIFNFLSARDLSVNVHIANSSFYLRTPATGDAKIMVHGTMLDEAYIVGRTLSGHLFNLSYVASPREVTAESVEAYCSSKEGAAARYPIKPHTESACDNLRVTMSSSKMILVAPDWRVTIKRQRVLDRVDGGERRIDMDLELLSPEAELPTMPHGIIGQSWDGDGMAVDGQLDQYPRVQGAVFTTYAMGEGAIEGRARDYEMTAPFEVRYKYSRFGTRGLPSRNRTALVKSCIASGTEHVGASDVRSVIRRVACHGAHRGDACTDTSSALTGLQPRISRDCSPGLSELAPEYSKLRGSQHTVQNLCEQTMGSFLVTLSPLGIPYTVPAGFTLNTTWSEVCPETCRAHGVAVAACPSAFATVGKHFDRVRRQRSKVA